MNIELWLLLLIPLFSGLFVWVLKSYKQIFVFLISSVIFSTALGIYVYLNYLKFGNLFAGNNWLFVDSLSVYHLLIMNFVYLMSSIYSYIYFKKDAENNHFILKDSKLYGSLWLFSLTAMTLVLISNNLAIMWVGMETTTLVTAFLISIHVSSESLEAMWKYLLICSVGVALAFMGTLLTAAAAEGLNMPIGNILLWTELSKISNSLNPNLIKFAFIFVLVGFGTKAGLAPMHNWLPDAHSQAPAPVSAIFSGFMLNAALYCIMRYIPITESALSNSGWSLQLLKIFGLISIMFAAAFILIQKDLKRLLAYSSIEHLGIITLGIGVGGFGVFASLFHILNHSVCKPLAFFSAGKLGQLVNTYSLDKLKGIRKISPVWAFGIFSSLLVLIGVAPFSIFMSEFLMMKSIVDLGYYAVFGFFVFGIGVVFIGVLGHIIPIFWGNYKGDLKKQKTTVTENLLVYFTLTILLILGLWMPSWLHQLILESSNIICKIQ